MRTEALILDDVDSASQHGFRVHHGKRPFLTEEEVEARLRRLCDRYKNLNAASHLVWLEKEPHVYDPNLDLHVKVEAVRWMLRIAKHMSEPAREVIFLRIENSLRQLEAAIEWRPRPVHSGAPTERLYRSAH
jgi:hypothetical protein